MSEFAMPERSHDNTPDGLDVTRAKNNGLNPKFKPFSLRGVKHLWDLSNVPLTREEAETKQANKQALSAPEWTGQREGHLIYSGSAPKGRIFGDFLLPGSQRGQYQILAEQNRQINLLGSGLILQANWKVGFAKLPNNINAGGIFDLEVYASSIDRSYLVQTAAFEIAFDKAEYDDFQNQGIIVEPHIAFNIAVKSVKATLVQKPEESTQEIAEKYLQSYQERKFRVGFQYNGFQVDLYSSPI